MCVCVCVYVCLKETYRGTEVTVGESKLGEQMYGSFHQKQGTFEKRSGSFE